MTPGWLWSSVSNLLTHSLKLLLINNKESLIKTIIINLDVPEELLLAEYVVPETKTPYNIVFKYKEYSFDCRVNTMSINDHSDKLSIQVIITLMFLSTTSTLFTFIQTTLYTVVSCIFGGINFRGLTL